MYHYRWCGHLKCRAYGSSKWAVHHSAGCCEFSLFLFIETNADEEFISFYVRGCVTSDSLIHLVPVSGTLRSNIDPFNLHDDASLWDALRRSYLVESKKENDESAAGRFTLDTVIEDEGANLSIGQVRAKHTRSVSYSI